MTPGARLAAAIDILDQLHAEKLPADAVAEKYFRSRRYAGSKDRRAVTERVFSVLRHRARLDWWCARIDESLRPGGRPRVLADLALADGLGKTEIAELFSGEGYAPAALTARETKLLDGFTGQQINHADMPDFVAHEFPAWIAGSLRDLYGERLGEEMDALNGQAPLDLRVNTLQGDCARALTLLKNDKIDADPTPYSPVGLRVHCRANLANTTAYKGGFVEVQDEGSQLLALVTGARPGMKVIDFCAGAGGKTLAMAAAMKDQGEIIACDVDAKRLKPITARLKRARVSIAETRLLMVGGDPWLRDHENSADVVFADVPCSGSGRWRRRPGARWQFSGRDLLDLVKIQQRIITEVVRLVKPGGRLVYATCSILTEENERQVDRLLDWFPGEYRVVPIAEAWADALGSDCPCQGPYLRLTPARHGTDGFFAAVLERKTEGKSDG